jgi:hypothetical protein
MAKSYGTFSEDIYANDFEQMAFQEAMRRANEQQAYNTVGMQEAGATERARMKLAAEERMRGTFDQQAGLERDIRGTFSDRAALDRDLQGTFSDRAAADRETAMMDADLKRDLAEMEVQAKLALQEGRTRDAIMLLDRQNQLQRENYYMKNPQSRIQEKVYGGLADQLDVGSLDLGPNFARQATYGALGMDDPSAGVYDTAAALLPQLLERDPEAAQELIARLPEGGRREALGMVAEYGQPEPEPIGQQMMGITAQIGLQQTEDGEVVIQNPIINTLYNDIVERYGTITSDEEAVGLLDSAKQLALQIQTETGASPEASISYVKELLDGKVSRQVLSSTVQGLLSLFSPASALTIGIGNRLTAQDSDELLGQLR